MPKSKRAKVVHLSKTQKKGRELSERQFTAIREAADQYQYCFVFSVENMRNYYLKEVRSQLSDSRLFFGKTKVMAQALGTTRENEHLPNLSSIQTYLHGNVGLLFTSQTPTSIIEYFASYVQTDFARAGVEASRDFTIPAGVIYSQAGEIPTEEDVPIQHSLEPNLRSWGVPTRLDKGKVIVDDDYEVCKEGQVLNSHQTALLKMFGVAIAEFRVRLLAYYDSKSEKVNALEASAE